MFRSRASDRPDLAPSIFSPSQDTHWDESVSLGSPRSRLKTPHRGQPVACLRDACGRGSSQHSSFALGGLHDCSRNECCPTAEEA
jgi:hypothetical protein